MSSHSTRSLARRALLCGCLLHLPAFAAQNTEDFEVWSDIGDILGLLSDIEFRVDDLAEKELLVRVGIVGGLAPEYLGADSYEPSYAPNLYIVWNDFLFLKGRKLGVQLFNGKHFYGGAFVRYTGGRSDNNDGLEGIGDISRTFTSGAYLNYRYEGIRLKSEVRHDFFDEGHGTLALASLGSRIPWQDPLFYLGVETTWASAEYMDTFFGINRFQSLRSGLGEYRPGAGIRDVSFKLSTAYALDQHWSIGAELRYQRLLGDAADSPIVREVGSENNIVLGVGINYTF